MAFERRILTTYDASTTGFDRGTRRVEQQLARLQRTTDSRLTQIDRRFERASRAALRLGTALGAVGVGLGVNEIRRYAESWRTAERQLTAAGFAIEGNREKLVALAVRVRGDFQSTSQAVSRFARVTGGDLEQSIRRVETLRKILAVGGASTAEQNSVSTQLSQALTSGVLQGDELRSIREAAPVELLDALARRAGATRGELKKLGEDGRLTSDVIIGALDDLASTADQKFAQLAISGSEAVEILSTGFSAFFGRVDEQLGATAGLNEFLADLGTFLAEDAEAARSFADALQLVAVAGASVAAGRVGSGVGGRGLSIFADIAQGAAKARAEVEIAGKAVRSVNRELLKTEQDLNKARQLRIERAKQVRLIETNLARSGRISAIFGTQISQIATETRSLTKARGDLERADRRVASAVAAVAAAKEADIVATNALSAATGRLTLAGRAAAASMTVLRGALAFFGGVPGLILAAATALIIFQDEIFGASKGAGDLTNSVSDLEGAVNDVRQAQEAYQSAISATAGAQTSASNSIVADTKREFDAKKSLLELEIKRQQALQAERRAAIAAVRGRLDQIPSADATRQNATRGLPQELEAQARGRIIDAEIARARRVAAVRDELKGLVAQADLAEVAINRALEAVDKEFAAGTAAGSGSGSGSGSGKAEKKSPLQSISESSLDRRGDLADEIEVIREQAQALGLSGEAARAAAISLAELEELNRLYADAASRGVEVTAEISAGFDRLASDYARVKVEADELRAAQELITEVTAREATTTEKLAEAKNRIESLLPSIIALVGDEARAHEIVADAIESANAEIIANDPFVKLSNDIFGVISTANSLEDALNKVLLKIVEIAAQKAFTALFSDGAGATAGAGGASGSGIGSFFGSVLGAFFHDGGRVGGPAKMRRVPAEAFIGAPRYHSGGVAGLAPNEVPAILERGEVVVPNGAQLSGGRAQSISIGDTNISITQPGVTEAQLQRILDDHRKKTIKDVVRLNERDPTIFHT